MKPTISKEEDQFLSELVEKCCEFEPNKRIEFKSICNLIENHFSKLDENETQNHKKENKINFQPNVEQYQVAPTPNNDEYKTTPAQNDYNVMKLVVKED